MIFWGIIYKTLPEEKKIFSVNIGFHGLMAIIILFDFLLNRIQLNLQTLQHSFSYMILYMIFNLTYTRLYEPIYTMLTWDSPKSVILLAVSFAITVIWFWFLLFVSFLKSVIS